MVDAGSQIIAKEGVRSLFKGAGANILRGVAGAGVLSLYDKLQELMFGKVYSVRLACCCFGILLTFRVDLVKRIAQSNPTQPPIPTRPHTLPTLQSFSFKHFHTQQLPIIHPQTSFHSHSYRFRGCCSGKVGRRSGCSYEDARCRTGIRTRLAWFESMSESMSVWSLCRSSVRCIGLE
jgi:hypothetical protein